MSKELSIESERPPDIPCNGERVTLMRDRFESIKNNYAGMLYFCQRITGINDVSMSNLSDFEFARFHRNEAFKKNMSFPISSYLKRIEELEKQLAQDETKGE